MEPITLSVILDCRHDASITGLTLTSLFATLSGLESEILILGKETGSSPGLSAAPDMISIRSIQQEGLPFFLSSYWKEVCRGEYILYVTSGIVWEEETMRNWLFYMEEHTKVGAIGGKLLDGRGNFIPASCQTFPNLWDKLRGRNGHILTDKNPEQPCMIDLLPPVNVLFRRKALDDNKIDDVSIGKGWNGLFCHMKKAGYQVCYLPQRFLVYREISGVLDASKPVRIKNRRLLVLCYENSFEEIKEHAVKRMPELQHVNHWDLGQHRVMDAICRRNRMKGFTDILFCYPDVRFEQMSLFAESLPATSTWFHIYNRNARQLISPENSYGTTSK